MPRLALLCLVAALLAGGRAEAHAQLVAADPPAGAVVASMPAEVVLRFNEPVAVLSARWFPPAGAPVDVAPRAEGAILRIPAPEAAGEGTYALSWRVASADGHPVGASHLFSVGAPSAAAAPPQLATARNAALARGLLTLALVVGAGGAAFARLVARDARPGGPAARLALAAALAVPPAAALALGVQGLDLLGDPAAGLFDAAPWAAALASPFARTAALAALSGLAALAALALPTRAGAALAAVAWGAAALSFALSGHAATAAPRWLTVPAVTLHAAGFVFWLGALPGLAVAAGPGLVPLLHRFAALATPLVVLLVLTGAALAAIQLGSPGAVLDTAYGRLLAAKLLAVLALLALAALNRFRLTPGIAAGAPGARRAFKRSVRAEIGLGLLILALASGFRLTPPPRALEAVPAELYVHLHGRSLMADVVLRPGRQGPNDVEIGLLDATFAPLAAREVALAFADPARGLEPIALAAAASDGRWSAGPLHLPRGGRWTLTLKVRIDDFTQETLETDLTLP